MKPAPPAIPLSELLGNPRPTLVRHGPDPLIRGLAYDSRKVRPGDLFVCLRGAKDDGHRHAVAAARGGAAAVHALSLARSGDTVLLAGKGHGDFQLVGGTRIPYSDRETVEQILRVRDAGRGLGCPAIPPEAF